MGNWCITRCVSGPFGCSATLGPIVRCQIGGIMFDGSGRWENPWYDIEYVDRLSADEASDGYRYGN